MDDNAKEKVRAELDKLLGYMLPLAKEFLERFGPEVFYPYGVSLHWNGDTRYVHYGGGENHISTAEYREYLVHTFRQVAAAGDLVACGITDLAQYEHEGRTVDLIVVSLEHVADTCLDVLLPYARAEGETIKFAEIAVHQGEPRVFV